MSGYKEKYPRLAELIYKIKSESPELCLKEVEYLLLYNELCLALEDLCIAVDEHAAEHPPVRLELRRDLVSLCKEYSIAQKHWKWLDDNPGQ